MTHRSSSLLVLPLLPLLAWSSACGGKAVVDPPLEPCVGVGCDDTPDPTPEPEPLPTACPEAQPTAGSACEEGLRCTYQGAVVCEQTVTVVAECVAGSWSVSSTPVECEPPALECPKDVPFAGVACPPFGPADTVPLQCTYTTSSPCPETYECVPGGTWQNVSAPCTG